MSLVDRLKLAIGDTPLDRVAREAGIDRRTLRRTLAGHRKQGGYLETIAALARVTHVRASWLAFEEGNMREEEVGHGK